MTRESPQHSPPPPVGISSRPTPLLRAIGALCVLSLVLSLYLWPTTPQAQPSRPADAHKPNIVLIVADDLGYSDIGVNGSEIPTPNIDRLARSGMLFTQFHAGMTCSPTRAMLLSGVDHHAAGLGVMGVPRNPAQVGQPGYEGYLNQRVASMAELLHDAGYHTYMTGKWHLGNDVETSPVARGFDHSFVSLDGAAHLGNLSWNGPGLAPYRDDEALVNVGEDFYTTRFYTERMIDYIERDRDDNQPFFAYLAYTAPHWPLQAPDESIAKFKGRYDAGYEALYDERLARAKYLGLVPKDHPGIPPIAGQPRWAELDSEQQRIESRKMEIYAAMVSDLDNYIGRFIEYLTAIGERDNTLIIFMSDNGPESTRRELVRPLSDWVAKCCDNSYDNLGRGNSYVMYGPNWARASAAPFRRAKATAFEGGTHVPAIFNMPGVIPAGEQFVDFATVVDILPTLLDVVGAEHPGLRYHGREILPLSGRSLWPALAESKPLEPAATDYFGWELYGHRAIRQGDWKIVWDPSERDAATWHLFDLARDPGEQNDLAATQLARLERMTALWDDYVARNGVVMVPPAAPPPRPAAQE